MVTSLPGRGPLTDEELERLEEFLGGLQNPERLTLEGLDGLFCALIAGPELVMPSEYLPIVWGGEISDEDAFESEAEASDLLGLMMQHWNAIIADLERNGVYGPLFDAPDERGVPGRRWAQGFMRGVELRRRSWSELLSDENEGQLFMIAVIAGEVDPKFPKKPMTLEQAQEARVMMAAGVARAYRHFASQRRATAAAEREAKTVRRAVPKVGRNEPCPCGSGRKFKQCCGKPDRALQ